MQHTLTERNKIAAKTIKQHSPKNRYFPWSLRCFLANDLHGRKFNDNEMSKSPNKDQHRPQNSPRWPNLSPIWCQHGSKCPNIAQCAQNKANMVPTLAYKGQCTPQNSLEIAQQEPKMVPMLAQHPMPKMAQDKPSMVPTLAQHPTPCTVPAPPSSKLHTLHAPRVSMI